MMRLYWAPHTRSFRALWLLEEAGRAYERVLVDLKNGAQSRPEYRAINPMMKVPALTDGDVKVAESGAICAYVADRVPEAGLAPALDDPARGRYLHWLFFSPGCTEPAYIQKLADVQLGSSTAGWGDFERVMAVLEAALAPGPWLLGERFSAADVLTGTDLHFGINVFKIVEPRPAFSAYLARCAERPAFKRAIAIDTAGA
ncbi:MAG TPA: glutathione S-transferase family protein [Stellaceae bacterium]|nr:glutathione S-transferase family protein [Stellaceae bacterium]